MVVHCRLFCPLSLVWLVFLVLICGKQQVAEVSQLGEVQMDEESNEMDQADDLVPYGDEVVVDDDDDWQEEEDFNDLDGPGSDFGVTQNLGSEEEEPQVLARLEETRLYFETQVNVNETLALVRDICRNKESRCTFWATIGECEKNPAYMQLNCAPACLTCDMAHVSLRCPLDPNAPDSLYPGGLDDLFERVVQDPALQIYEPTVLSRPYFADGDGPDTATYQIGLWLVVFDNVLTQEEADRLLKLAAARGYRRSQEIGKQLEDGTYSSVEIPGRTSTNAWCSGECYKDAVVQKIAARMEHITGIPEENAEYFQLVRYEEGQQYDVHNDYFEFMRDRPFGVRILTFFMYLSDVEGGETSFPRPGLKVKPKVGRAVLWPNVLNEDPNANDLQADHEALPVRKGIKYGANAWYHQRNAKSDFSMSCSL